MCSPCLSTHRVPADNCYPCKLQALIRKVFEAVVSEVHVEGVEVVPFPLYAPLDGKTASDYIARVEPSSSGGRKMAAAFLDALGLT